MAKNINRGPGRPKYEPVIPKGRFTMLDFCEANGVNLKTGKGKNCSRLTLIKFLARDAKSKGHSRIVRLKDTVAEPNSEDGLGRKSFVYQRRTAAVAKSPRKSAPKAKVDTKVANAAYETQKAALLAPTPAVEVAAPAPTPEPMTMAETITAPTAEVPASEPVSA